MPRSRTSRSIAGVRSVRTPRPNRRAAAGSERVVGAAASPRRSVLWRPAGSARTNSEVGEDRRRVPNAAALLFSCPFVLW